MSPDLKVGTIAALFSAERKKKLELVIERILT